MSGQREIVGENEKPIDDPLELCKQYKRKAVRESSGSRPVEPHSPTGSATLKVSTNKKTKTSSSSSDDNTRKNKIVCFQAVLEKELISKNRSEDFLQTADNLTQDLTQYLEIWDALGLSFQFLILAKSEACINALLDKDKILSHAEVLKSTGVFLRKTFNEWIRFKNPKV